MLLYHKLSCQQALEQSICLSILVFNISDFFVWWLMTRMHRTDSLLDWSLSLFSCLPPFSPGRGYLVESPVAIKEVLEITFAIWEQLLWYDILPSEAWILHRGAHCRYLSACLMLFHPPSRTPPPCQCWLSSFAEATLLMPAKTDSLISLLCIFTSIRLSQRLSPVLGKSLVLEKWEVVSQMALEMGSRDRNS